ncbi:MAG: PaaX family transcriptional regulator C-terminal domain-containing protein [Actinomycetota bacterium]
MPEPTELATPTRAFVLGIADDAGAIDAAALYEAADAVGFSSTRVRLTLRRLVESGSVTVDGRGRSAAIRLTPAGLDERRTDLTWVAAAHRLDAGLDIWDGVWHLAAFEIPERSRAARDAVRGALVDLLCGSLSGGLYVSPWPIERWIAPVAHAHGVTDRMTYVQSTAMSVAGRQDPLGIAMAVWPVERLAAGYADFVERWSPAVVAPPADRAEAVRMAFTASAEIEGLLRIDPVLPAVALPDDFAGPAARRLYRELLAVLRDHDVIATSNVFGAYESAIVQALRQSSSAFWSAAGPTST